MTVHDFNFDPKKNDFGVKPERAPSIDQDVLEPRKHKDALDHLTDTTNLDSEESSSLLPTGFETMDRGVKEWLTGIRVPTRDGVRDMQVRIAGGDKSFLVWKQDLVAHRVKLPVCSVNRTSWKMHPEKFSPPIHHMRRRFDKTSDKMILTFRPSPRLIDYTLSIWAERKRDIEYILGQIEPRFNPIAEFFIEDEYLGGSVQVIYNGATNTSDVDIGAKELAKVRYDINITIEGWIPLPNEKVVSTVLGRVQTLKEEGGPILDTTNGKGVWNG